MKKIIIVAFVLSSFISRQVFAQPANDDCTTAQNLGTLPVPAACPSGAGTAVNVAGTIVAATSGNPYIYQNGCSGAGGPNMGVPADDVWYSFVASGYQAVITVNSTFANPNIAMYAGSCASLGGGVGGCAVGSAGTVTLTVDQMVIGTTYYLQISGNTGQSGTFNLIAKNNKGCSDCINSTTLTVSPLPVNGMYNPGQTVHFCYHISSYAEINTNWLHGVQVGLGSGWNSASLVASAVTTYDCGTWTYYPVGITGWPAGFYFNRTCSPLGGGTAGDGIPDNNYGDHITANTTNDQNIYSIPSNIWNFCFDVTVAAGCNPGSSLSVVINTSGDGESGPWTSAGCSSDPATPFNAIGACCQPTMSSVPTTCAGNDGAATATPVGVSGPYNYSWTNSGGTVISTTNGVAGSNTITGLVPGTYTVGITNSLNCLVTNTVIVSVGGTVGVPTAGSNSPICAGATIDLTAATITGVNYSWAGPNGFTSAIQNPSIANATTAASGIYTVTGTLGICINTSTVNVTVNPLPALTITSPAAVCSPLTVNITVASVTAGSTGAGTLSYWTNAGATTALATPTAVSASGIYYIQSITAAGCKDIQPVNVTINPSPVLTITNPAAVCAPLTVDITLAAVTAGSTGGGVLTYWTDAAATISLTSPTAVSASGTYYIQATAAGGCKDIKPVTVTINPLPVLNITDPAAVCSPLTVDITAALVTAGSTGAGTLSYWNDFAATTSLATPTAISTSGTYYIQSISAGGCKDIKPVTVTINPLPVLTITNPAAVCSPNTVNLTASAVTVGTTGGGTLSYWSDAGATTALSSPAAVANSGTYYIQTTTAAGCTDIEQVIVTINSLPVLVITNPAAVCSPLTVDITAAAVTAGSTGGGTLTYWTNPVATNLLATPTGVSNSATYYIQSITAAGCKDIQPVTVLINTTPVLIITDPGAVCSPNTVDITAAAVTAGSTGGGTLTYWTDGTATTNLATPAAITTSGTYYIQTLTAAGCKDINPVVVTINPLPILVISNPAQVCSPLSVDITLPAVTAGSIGNGALTYWTTVGATIALATPDAIVVSGTYYIQSVAAGGCSDIQPVTVTINSLPVLNITNPANVCSPNTVDITNSSVTTGSTGGGVLTYWSDVTATTPLTTPTAVASSGTYYIQTTTASGCKDINPVLVIIEPLPILVITDPAAVCAPGTVDITGASVTSGSTGGGTLSYWTDVTATTPLTTPTAVATTGTYYIKTTTTPTGCTDIKPVLVTINPLPTPMFAADNLSGCSPVCVNFTDGTTVVSGIITSWNWDFGGAGISSTQNPSFCFTIPGSYNVTLSATTNSGCNSISTPTVITVFPDPMAEFNPTPNPASVLDATVTMNNQSSADVTYWHWTFGDGDSLSPNTPSPIHTYPDDMAGNYTATLIVHNANGCYATVSHEIIIAPEFTFFIPNAFSPNGDFINDTFYGQGIGIEKYEIYIFDRWGNNVFYGDDVSKAWDGKANHGSEIAQQDVYVWKVKLLDVLGKKHNYIGTVTIVK